MLSPVAELTAEQARDIAECHPAVKSGLLEFDVRPGWCR
jgi:hypothetical protein